MIDSRLIAEKCCCSWGQLISEIEASGRLGGRETGVERRFDPPLAPDSLKKFRLSSLERGAAFWLETSASSSARRPHKPEFWAYSRIISVNSENLHYSEISGFPPNNQIDWILKVEGFVLRPSFFGHSSLWFFSVILLLYTLCINARDFLSVSVLCPAIHTLLVESRRAIGQFLTSGIKKSLICGNEGVYF